MCCIIIRYMYSNQYSNYFGCIDLLLLAQSSFYFLESVVSVDSAFLISGNRAFRASGVGLAR